LSHPLEVFFVDVFVSSVTLENLGWRLRNPILRRWYIQTLRVLLLTCFLQFAVWIFSVVRLAVREVF
jgi:hypothetical protein